MSNGIEADKNSRPFFYLGSVVEPGEGRRPHHFAATEVNQREAAAAIAALSFLAGGTFEVSDTGIMSAPLSLDEVPGAHDSLAATGNVVHTKPFGIDVAEARLGVSAVDTILRFTHRV